MSNAPHRIGVCSWSLQPESARDLARRIAEAGLQGVQLALDPLRTGHWKTREVLAALEDHGIALYSGMMGTQGEDYTSLETIARTGGVRPDEHWQANLRAARDNARLAGELDLRLVSFHAGFLPEDASNPERAKMLDRLRLIVDAFDEHGVRVAFETGQETAETLLAVLAELERPRAGVNFDPANMILYDKGEPVAALDALAAHVLQVHVKDATRTTEPGAWGEEVVVGTGEVDWEAFFATLARHELEVDLLIEREAGTQRVADIRSASAVIGNMLGASPR